MKKYLVCLALAMLGSPANALSAIGGGNVEITPNQCTESSYKICTPGITSVIMLTKNAQTGVFSY
ncbi:MAG: hypothetical protein K2I81_01670 [Alphaproteobacteria bacterium]|nr:hypothetical protein [Alphaproteobacteria bacterium]